jgi:hypothetical protein
VLTLTLVDDENTEGVNREWRQCIPTQTAENHKTPNTLLPGACDFRHPKRTQLTEPTAVNTQAEL